MLDRLPFEMCGVVSSFLPFLDLIQCLQVSKAFKASITNPACWKDRYVSFEAHSFEDLIAAGVLPLSLLPSFVSICVLLRSEIEEVDSHSSEPECGGATKLAKWRDDSIFRPQNMGHCVDERAILVRVRVSSFPNSLLPFSLSIVSHTQENAAGRVELFRRGGVSVQCVLACRHGPGGWAEERTV